MKRGFAKLLSIPIPGMGDEDEEPEEAKQAEDAEAIGQHRQCALRQELKRRQREASQYIITSARLITPVLDKDNSAAGYKYIIDVLKPDHEDLASELEIDMAIQYLKQKQFSQAIEVLKSFEKKDQQHRAMAATNLSFIYFLEQEYTQAEKYADLAYTHDRYNAKALVNKVGRAVVLKDRPPIAPPYRREPLWKGGRADRAHQQLSFYFHLLAMFALFAVVHKCKLNNTHNHQQQSTNHPALP
mmetsp:Transcript_100272/g.286620  ORF Transcript_100272/g.286620 Transcript_100272/m.286620 type:complete len:243 (+) Transcript_100272:1043-1771(+)